METMGLVSIIMPVYNGEMYLRDAVDSILSQTYKNFEFLIINDGSTDGTEEILEKYTDKRIKILNNNENKGLIYSLNRGLKISKGKYIARMDADDIALNNRLYEQVKYLENNKDIAMCDGVIKVFKNNIKFINKKVNKYISSGEIKVKLLFRNPVVHPAVMIRRSSIEKYNLEYNVQDKGIEDYGLWIHISKFLKIGRVDSTILMYRFLSTSISSDILKKIEIYKLTLKNCFKREYKEIFEKLTDRELSIHIEIMVINNINQYEYTLKQKIEYLDKLKQILLFDKKYSKECIVEEINERKMECYINHLSFIKVFKLNRRQKLISLRSLIFIKLKKFIKKILR